MSGGNLAGPSGSSDLRRCSMWTVSGICSLRTSIGVLSTTPSLMAVRRSGCRRGDGDGQHHLRDTLDHRPSDRTIAAGTHARGVFTAQIPSTFTTVTAQVRSGWNLVSLPVTAPLDSVTEVFPQAVSAAFGFVPGTGYSASPVLEPGTGYWLKLPARRGCGDLGSAPCRASRDGVSGMEPHRVGDGGGGSCRGRGSSPPGIVVSPFYEFGPTGYAPVSGAAAGRRGLGEGRARPARRQLPGSVMSVDTQGSEMPQPLRM